MTRAAGTSPANRTCWQRPGAAYLEPGDGTGPPGDGFINVALPDSRGGRRIL